MIDRIKAYIWGISEFRYILDSLKIEKLNHSKLTGTCLIRKGHTVVADNICGIAYCITLYFRGRKSEFEIFSREVIFANTVQAKISSRENIFSRK